MKKIIRVFPSRTKGTPIDDDVRIDEEPGFFDKADEIHISVTFTWDLKRAEQLAKAWETVAPVRVGGPALGDPGGEFTPGLYLKKGYAITSRGCNNKCSFCYVPPREGRVRELEIKPGRLLQDNNILQCSEGHIRAVFAMLKKNKPCELTGGLEASILKPWHCKLISELKPHQAFLAYDTPGDREPVADAVSSLLSAGFKKSGLRVYVLIGFPGDTFEAADERLKFVYKTGAAPSSMLWRTEDGKTPYAWQKFNRVWARVSISRARMNSGEAIR